MKRDAKMLTWVYLFLGAVLSLFLMGAKGCPTDDTPPRDPAPLKSQQWTNNPDAKVGTAEFGAYCDGQLGQKDYTPTGIPVECKTNRGENRPRWRNG